MDNIIVYIALIIAGYFIGSLSPSTFISKIKGIDIKKEGSGNAGATNAFRVLGPKLAILIFVLDFLKCFIPSFLIIMFLEPFVGYCVSVTIVLGHVFSIFHHFKAGKGVSAGIGAMFAANWLIGTIVFVLSVLLVIITRRVSIGSLTGAILLPILSWFIFYEFFPYALAIGLILIYAHRQNIVRLFKREEKALW